MNKRIRIIVSGGLIQDIQNIPPGIIVDVWDYDCETEDTSETDSIGDPVIKSEWHPDNYRCGMCEHTFKKTDSRCPSCGSDEIEPA